MASVTVPKLALTAAGWRARKVIPEDARSVFGKREAKASWPASLSRSEAASARDKWNRELTDKIAAVRAGRVSLSDDQVKALAAKWYRVQKPQVLAEGETRGGYNGALEVLREGQSPTVLRLIHERAVAVLQSEGVNADTPSTQRLAAELLHLHEALYEHAKEHAKGKRRDDPQEARLPTPQAVSQTLHGPRVLALYEQWASHAEQRDGNARSTLKRYRGVFAPFAAFLSNPPAASVTPDDVARYFEHRLAGGLSPRTARDVHKAALSSVFGWARGKRLVATNPVSGYRIKARKKARVRDKSFTDAEAATILSAARAIIPDGAYSATRRWVPVLCAYTGARVQEMTQLRKADVHRHPDGFYFLRLTGEAGTIKDRDTRDVPLHPRVVKEGFVRFVKAAHDGPLFYDPKTRRRADAETSLAESRARKLAQWVREDVGVTDPGVAPNHAWRHRFKTAATRAGIEGRYADAITGHAPRTQGEDYGEKLAAVLYREVKRIKIEWIEGILRS